MLLSPRYRSSIELPKGDHVLGVSLPGPVPTRVRFEPLDEAAGRALIETYAPSADSRFEYEE
jgi:hypothetical protein